MRAAQFEEHKENLMVVYTRPKPEKDVDVGVPHHLGYFLSAMLKRKSKPLVATLESWCPGSGLPVMLAGHNILTLISDLKPHQFYEVINIYSDHTSDKICPLRSTNCSLPVPILHQAVLLFRQICKYCSFHLRRKMLISYKFY